MSEKVAILIPMYKEALNEHEKISLRQGLGTLGAHPFIIVAPEGLSLEGIDFLGRPVRVERFAPSYFQGIAGYNRLMMSEEFYRRFLIYKYILIHQLDAFVFKDDLDGWCRRGYDYVGAPWLDQDWVRSARRTWLEQKLLSRLRPTRRDGVGNGGFSLRKVRSHFLALKLPFFRRKAAVWRSNEDIFWSFYVPAYLPLFRPAPTRDAIGFSFETDPRRCYELNRRELPFGCHAWEKYDIEFWRPHFERIGYQI